MKYFWLIALFIRGILCFASISPLSHSNSASKLNINGKNGHLEATSSSSSSSSLSILSKDNDNNNYINDNTIKNNINDNKFKSNLPKVNIPLPNPSFLERITFGWTGDLIRLGNQKVIELEDLWLLPEDKRTAYNSITFEKLYEIEKEKKKLKMRNNKHQIMTTNTTTTTTTTTTDNVTVNEGTDVNEEEELQKNKNILSPYIDSPLIRTLFKMYKSPLLISGGCKAINTCVQFIPSLIVSNILKIADTTSKVGTSAVVATKLQNQGKLLALSLFMVLSLKTLFENQYFYIVTNTGTNIRGTLSAALYQKSLRLSPGGRTNTTLGEIVNYMQLDANRMEGVATSVHIIWDGLFQVLGYTALLLNFLGPSVFAGIAILLSLIPLNAYFYEKLSATRTSVLKATDSRVKLTNEVLQGVRAVKSYNWERAFENILFNVRENELNNLKEGAKYRGLLVGLMSAAPALVASVTLAVYSALGNQLSPAKVFTALALFNQLRFPLIFYPMVINTLAEGKPSLARLTKFFNSEEVVDYVERGDGDGEDGIHSDSVVAIKDGSFSWTCTSSTSIDNTNEESSSSSSKILKNINLDVKKGELVAVIGSVGSGKTMLLNALLGELYKSTGQVRVKGEVAYVPQQAWIPNETFRNVVLFGKPYDEDKYNSVIKSCHMEHDVELLEAGHDTEIGEKGINLSGGQKQRLSIARAVYDEADVYLFDDPLSALDSQIGNQVFQDCILDELSDKTRILVTNQRNVIPFVDRVVIMSASEDGKSLQVLDQGTFEELNERGHDLSKSGIISANGTNDDSSGNNSSESNDDIGDMLGNDIEVETNSSLHKADSSLTYTPTTTTITTTNDKSEKSIRSISDSTSTTSSDNMNLIKKPESIIESTTTTTTTLPTTTTTTKMGKLIVQEERAQGAVGWNVYSQYLGQIKRPMAMMTVIASFGFANFMLVFQQWIVAAWTKDIGYVKRPLALYLLGTSSMAVGVAVFQFIRTYLGTILGVDASRAIHKSLLRSILQAPLQFFEVTPIGRILQRFSKDLDAIDQQLPGSMGQVVGSSLQIAAAVIAVSIVTPAFGIVMLPVFTLYFLITNRYRPVARELKRLDTLSRSPIYTHFSESLSGLQVLRSFKRQKSFSILNENKVDDNLSAFFALKAIDRWLSTRLEFLGNFIVLSAALLVVTATKHGSKSSYAGISLNNALSITSLLNWAVRNGADTETLMNSVERLLYYINNINHEKDLNLNEESPYIKNENVNDNKINNNDYDNYNNSKKNIIKGGDIVVKDVSMAYSDDSDPVLKKVSFHIKAGESVGIVGRTGSGKSSLFRVLLRLTDIDSGYILINGKDISNQNLEILRNEIAIIPQDPVLFSGNIRSNLDPFHEHDDMILIDALRQVNMLPKNYQYSNSNYLNLIVSENGENFSTGQKQLICLARALIRKPQILLLDEATSSIDYATDTIIQKTIRDAFIGKTTIITIAHRLKTIIDNQKILVMNNGEAVEFDSPSNLLKNHDSIFSNLVRAENDCNNNNINNNNTIIDTEKEKEAEAVI